MAANSKDNPKDYLWGKRKSKKWIIIGASAGVLIIAVAGYLVFGLDLTKNPLTTSGGTRTNSQQALTRRAIDGVYVSTDQAHYYPIGVMIENLVSSRPPAGLAKANVVYEALAEGGITRFLAVYAVPLITVPEIGPVRSARPYYVDWAQEYKALYVHVGGSPQALIDIETYDVFDLNQFYNAQYFWRSTDRQPPHNLYTSGEKLAYALRDKNAPAAGDYTTWQFKDEASLSDRPTGDKNIIIDFSSFNYKVEYRYDRERNEYVRYQGGEVHKDKDSAEMRPKNVVVQKVKTQLEDAERLGMDTTDSGEALLFRDGATIPARWEKKARGERTMFYAEDGSPLTFNAGTTWVEVVPTTKDIVYN